MKIIDVKTKSVRVPLQEGSCGTSSNWFREVSLTIVEILTDEGITGISISSGRKLSNYVIENVLKPMLIGEDPLLIEKIWNDVYTNTFRFGRAGVVIEAISGIDVALWDIAGKVAKMPVYKLLGGYRKKVPTYVMTGYYKKGVKIEQLLEKRYTYWVNEGFKAIKMKVGRLSIDQDVRRVKIVRDAIGYEVDLMLDANGIYTPYQAIRFAKKVERYEPYWFEEPVRADNVKGYIKVVKATDIPISGGENESLRYAIRPLVENGALDVVQVDVLHSGGFTEFRKISALASAYNLPTGLHCSAEYVVSMHLAASDPNSISVEVRPDPDRNPLHQVLWKDPPLIKDGFIELPDKPGLGIELNEEKLKKFLHVLA